jgi:hypothetical protein
MHALYDTMKVRIVHDMVYSTYGNRSIMHVWLIKMHDFQMLRGKIVTFSLLISVIDMPIIDLQIWQIFVSRQRQ